MRPKPLPNTSEEKKSASIEGQYKPRSRGRRRNSNGWKSLQEKKASWMLRCRQKPSRKPRSLHIRRGATRQSEIA